MFTRLVPVVCAAVLLAGCGGAAAPPSEGVATSGGAFPVTVAHVFGGTTVDAPPQRVAALGFGDQDVLLALGVVPVVANQFVPSWTNGVGPWGQDLLRGQAPTPIDGNDLNLELILAQRPDLVVAANLALDRGAYDQLSALVPVVAGPVGFEPYSIPWQEHTRHVGAAVGLGAEAEALVADTEASVTAAAAANPGFAGHSVQVVTALPEVGNIRAYTSTARGYLLETLGLDIPAWVDTEAGDGFYVDIAAESAGRLDSDVIVFLGTRDEFAAQPLLAALPAAARGSVVFFDDYDVSVAFAAPGPLTIPFTLDELVPALATATAALPA